jgi:hypothetical protein
MKRVLPSGEAIHGMSPGSRAVLLLSVLVLSTVAVAPGLAALETTGGADGQPQTTDSDPLVTQTLVIDLQEDGDARWTIRKTYNLTSRDETIAFDDVAADFEAGRTDDLGLGAFENASRLASASTGREMRVTNVTRETSRTGTVTDGTGTLSISFTWTAFGRVEGDRFHVDDVFTTQQGPWLERLERNQRLVIQPPEGYEFFDAPVPVTLRNGTIQWTGPREFETDSLSATFEQTETQPPPTGNGTATPGGSGQNGDEDDSSLLVAVLVVLGLGTVAVVGYLLVQQEVLAFSASEDEAPAVPTADGASKTVVDDPDTGQEATPESAEAGATDDADETADDDAIDEELLSDEERVERLLEENGGRMKQANIVKETGWSNAKVSQLLSAMAEADRIDKLRIGRENLISFPDEDVTEFDE